MEIIRAIKVDKGHFENDQPVQYPVQVLGEVPHMVELHWILLGPINFSIITKINRRLIERIFSKEKS